MEKPNSKSFNLLVNASNQANVCGTNNYKSLQINSLFLFVSPFAMDNMAIEDLDINIKVDDGGSILINDQAFDPVEIKPGINILGIIVRK